MSAITERSSVVSQVCAPEELSPRDRAEMVDLFNQHFDGVTRDQFERDLAEKNVVLTLRDGATDALAGFSTMLVYETSVDGSPISVVCSGDTIVDPSAWSSAALPREWIAAVNRLRRDYRNGPYYWLLLTSGFRTYRLLSTFWQRFHPRHDALTPPDQLHLMNALATERFGERFNRVAGVVRFDRPQMLKAHLAGIPPERLTDPHVACFARLNPGHARGDELVCLARFHPDNLTAYARRLL